MGEGGGIFRTLSKKFGGFLRLPLDNKSCYTILVDSNTIFEPDTDPQNSPFGPQKTKTTLYIR